MKTEEKKRNGISMMVGCFAMAGSAKQIAEAQRCRLGYHDCEAMRSNSR